MADTYTTNYQFLMQEDGAVKWGKGLNDNFNSIDSLLYNIQNRDNFINSGVINNDIEFAYTIPHSWNGTTVYEQLKVTNMKVCFNLQEMLTPGETKTITINVNSLGVTIPNNSYENIFYGLVATEDTLNDAYSISTYVTTDFNNFINNDLTNKYIYVGNVVAFNDNGSYYLVKELSAITPWYANFESFNRTKDLISYGETWGGNISTVLLSGAWYLRNKDKFYWIYEGINYSNPFSPHYKSDFVKTSGIDIQFFRAYNNKKVDLNELVPTTTLDPTKYMDASGNSQTVTSNYYTIQRYAILPTGYGVVFYGDKQYETIQEARNDLYEKNDISVMIPNCKELARIIVRNASSVMATDCEVYNIEEKEEESKLGSFNQNYFSIKNDNNNSSLNFEINNDVTLLTDSIKNSYFIGDASEVRSNGILPGATITLSGNNITIANCTMVTSTPAFNGGDSVLTYTPITYSGAIQGTPTSGWNRIVLVNNIPTYAAIDSQAITIGYIHYNSGIDYSIIKPQMGVTPKDSKNIFSCVPVIMSNTGTTLRNDESDHYDGCGILSSSHSVISEGINYTNANPNYRLFNQISPDVGANGALWTIFNPAVKQGTAVVTPSSFGIQTRALTTMDLSGIQNNHYTIFKILQDTNGNFIVINKFSDYETIDDVRTSVYSLDEAYDFPTYFALEISRIILKKISGTVYTVIEAYQSNRNVLGNIQVPPPVSTTSEFTMDSFRVVRNNSEIALDYSGNGTVTVTVPSTATGVYTLGQIGGKDVVLTNPASGDILQYDGTKFVNVSLSSTITNLQNQINTLSNSLNTLMNTTLPESYVKRFTTEPQAAQIKTGYIWIDNGKVKFYNGSAWEQLNTWQ